MKRTILAFACAMAGLSILLTAALIHLAVFRSFSLAMQNDTALAALDISALIRRFGMDAVRSVPFLGTRITLIDEGGQVLYDSDAEAGTMENHRDRPEVRQARETGVGKSTRYSETMGKDTYYHAIKLGDGTVLRTAKTMDSLFAQLGSLLFISLGIACAVFIAAVCLGERLTRKLVEPINRIDLDHPEQNRVYDELTPLLRRIKGQQEAMAAQMREMRKWRLEFEAITENMREGLLILDQDGRVLVCNKSARTLLDVRLEGVKGRDILTVRRDEPFRKALEQARQGAAAEAAFTIGNRHIQIFASPVQDRDISLGKDALQGVVLVVLDVTEREDRDRLRREFTANVSHELKTPLMALSGYAELMAGGLVNPEDRPRFAQNIYQEAQRLITLIKDIMTLSKLDEGGIAVRERVDLAALIQELIGRIAKAAEVRGITLSFTTALPEAGAEIMGLRPVLEEMILNLLDNAVKYNVDGGKIQVSLEQAGPELILSVADTGIGIPAEEQDRIFERFYRVDKSRSRAVEGTGLGLSIVKHGAALHNGKIEVQSDGKTGSCFRLRLKQGAGNE